jgi:Domain of unknown function (DUF932)
MYPTISQLSKTPKLLSNDDVIALAPATGSSGPVQQASERYSFVPTLTVIDALRDIGWFPIDVKQSKPRLDDHLDFQKHLVRFTHRQPAVLDNERVDLLLWNSHDLGSSFKIFAGVWRFVCGNGMMVGSEFLSFSHKHVGFDINKLVESAQKIANHAGVVAGQIIDMKAISLSHAEQSIFAEAAHRLIYDDPRNAPIRSEDLLSVRRNEDNEDNLWTVTNRCQENIIRGGLRGSKIDGNGRRRKVTTRPVKSLDRDVKLNQALWHLAERMKELKTQDNNC